MNNDKILLAQNLASGYQNHNTNKVISKNINFELAKGRVLAVIGPNGGGKTTILRTCMGFIPALEGDVFLNNKSVFALSPKERALYASWVPQNTNIPWSFDVTEIISQARYSRLGAFRSFSKSDYQAIENAINLMDLKALSHRDFCSLSGGEAKRVIIARAMAQDTELLVLDEPAAHLDPGRQIELMKMIKSLAFNGKAIVVSVHDVNLALHFADSVLLVRQNGGTMFGTPTDVLTKANLEDAFGTAFVEGSCNNYGEFFLPRV